MSHINQCLIGLGDDLFFSFPPLLLMCADTFGFDSFINGRSLSEARANDLYRKDIADAATASLQALHNLKVAHRDIKLQNFIWLNAPASSDETGTSQNELPHTDSLDIMAVDTAICLSPPPAQVMVIDFGFSSQTQDVNVLSAEMSQLQHLLSEWKSKAS